jgi:cytochrome bd-type quinol oxidase subunit 1
MLGIFFLYLIVNSWIQILYFDSKEKSDYYIATLFIIPLITCLIVVLGWDLDKT